MREVKFDLNDIPQEMFVLAASDYTELSEGQLLANSANLGITVMFNYANSLIARNESVRLVVTAGDSIVLKTIVVKEEDGLKLDAESLSNFLNVPVDEMMRVGASANILEADETFVHPLSEVNGDRMNAYALGSMLINGLRLKGDYGDPELCESFLVNSILKIKPETDVNFLIGRVKLHQEAAMYEVCTILSDMGKLVS